MSPETAIIVRNHTDAITRWNAEASIDFGKGKYSMMKPVQGTAHGRVFRRLLAESYDTNDDKYDTLEAQVLADYLLTFTLRS